MKFCPQCGATLLTQNFCQECGYEIKNNGGDANGLSFDFSALESKAKSQLYEQEGLVVENGVLTKYKGKRRSIVIPSTVEEVYNSAFESNEIVTFVEFENGLKIIGENAFKNCSSLVKVSIPASCEKVYNSAFAGTKLESVVLEARNDEIVKACVSDKAREFLRSHRVGDYIKIESGAISL